MDLTLTPGPVLDAYMNVGRPTGHQTPTSLCTKAPDNQPLDSHSFGLFKFLVLSIPIKLHMQYTEDSPASNVIGSFLSRNSLFTSSSQIRARALWEEDLGQAFW